jgi:hypothetical protein
MGPRVTPDSGYLKFLVNGNLIDQYGSLVVEIMPGQHLPLPVAGEHIAVFGTWFSTPCTAGTRSTRAIKYLDTGRTVYALPPSPPLYGHPPAPSPGGNCDPSYPTVCIPSPPPDLDCGDIPYRNFKVLPPDPHGFDGDHEGMGCET